MLPLGAKVGGFLDLDIDFASFAFVLRIVEIRLVSVESRLVLVLNVKFPHVLLCFACFATHFRLSKTRK